MKKLTKLIPLTITLMAMSCSFNAGIKDKDTSVKVTGVSLNYSSYDLYMSRTIQLREKVSPLNATNKNVTWSSSDNSIINVDNGLVSIAETANVGDTATVTVTTKDGGHKATCDFTISELINSEWTILMYVCGSNLESDFANLTTYYDPTTGEYYQWNGQGLATMDINEILATPNQPEDVNILIETGGSNKWTNSFFGHYGDYNIDAKKLQIHRVENNSIVLEESLSYQSMGEASTLQHFIEYGLNHYPAKKTALILWNHGGGLQGVCFDERANGDGLTEPEVISAVSGAINSCGLSGQKLEWIGYDACMMQLQDNALINSEYFNYMVGSQETESGFGWDYSSWIDDLYAKEDTETILQAIVDGFIEDNGGPANNEYNQTLSYLNLTYAEEYKDAWEALALELSKKINHDNVDSFATILVYKTKKFYEEYYYVYGLFDVKDFIKNLAMNSTFNPGVSYLQAVEDAFNKLMGYFSCNKGAGNAHGLSLYWAVNSYTSYYNDYSSGYTNLSNWQNLVNTYGG